MCASDRDAVAVVAALNINSQEVIVIGAFTGFSVDAP